jgi:asparagine synthase (glutamine-hydrolysing)
LALLSELGQNDVLTFSIGFDSVSGHAGDEFQYSDLIAKHFGTKHRQIRVDGGRALSALPSAIKAMSEPMVSHDAVAFYLLSEEVSKHVKVVQSGQGADEVFGGYSWYPPFLAVNDAPDEYRRRYFDWNQPDLEKLLAPSYLGRTQAACLSIAFSPIPVREWPLTKFSNSTQRSCLSTIPSNVLTT